MSSRGVTLAKRCVLLLLCAIVTFCRAVLRVSRFSCRCVCSRRPHDEKNKKLKIEIERVSRGTEVLFACVSACGIAQAYSYDGFSR